MGTPKRERQKANRQQKLIQEERDYRASNVKRNVIRWGSIAVALVLVFVVVAAIGGAFSGDDDDATTATTVPGTTVPAATTVPVTYAVPDEPSVSIPAEVPTELVITTLEPGSGPEAAAGDTVVVYYVGVRSADGEEFDNSYARGSTFPVALGSGTVIQGWEDGLIGAQAGERRQLDIPADLAYGDQGAGSLIQPGDALTFVIDVVDVIKADS